MKKYLSAFILLFVLAALVSCGEAQPGDAEEGSGEHTIAVLVYDYGDEEVVSFRNYLEDYIGQVFDVKFLYSQSIRSGEEAMSFIKDAAEYGAEGVMSFNSYDLKAEVELAASYGMYFMMGSGTVSEKAFASVKDNEYFLGTVGPGKDIEYQAGVDLAEALIGQGSENSYFILSGGAAIGNEMHRIRTEAILDTLQEAYGVTFDKSAAAVTGSRKPVHLEAGELKVCICPGYLSVDDTLAQAKEEYARDGYKTVLSVQPVTAMLDVLKGAELGVIDCYSETNLRLFAKGDIDYVTGKYSSIIGPSFAAMYNAITGHADRMRDGGSAFRICQGFWSSDSSQDYETKYSLASGIEMNAYNYEDLQNVICEYNENADLQALKTLAEAYKYEDALERRAAQ